MLILYTLFFSLGYAAFITLLYAAMQQDELFDVVSGGRWGKWINKMYNDRNKLESVLGGCMKCTSFWFALPYTIAFMLVLPHLGVNLGLLMSLVWFTISWTIFAFLGLYALVKINK
jgi:hypothetical protein